MLIMLQSALDLQSVDDTGIGYKSEETTSKLRRESINEWVSIIRVVNRKCIVSKTMVPPRAAMVLHYEHCPGTSVVC
jgi:hypothetical protein